MILADDRYGYRVCWSAEDGEYVGLCTEFRSLSWLAKTPEGALRGIRRLVGGVVADLRESGEPVPPPLTGKRFSGKFLVRIPPEEDRWLALEAAEQGVSLNRLVSLRLARSAK